jgi:hypothetical protein
MPLGDYGELADIGWDAGVQVESRVRETFGYGLDVFYNSTSGDILGADVDYSILQLGAHITGYLRMRGDNPLTPYGQVGISYYNQTADTPAGDATDGDIGLAFVGGLLFMQPTSKVGLAADVSLHSPFTLDAAQFMNFNAKIVFALSER